MVDLLAKPGVFRVLDAKVFVVRAETHSARRQFIVCFYLVSLSIPVYCFATVKFDFMSCTGKKYDQ